MSVSKNSPVVSPTNMKTAVKGQSFFFRNGMTSYPGSKNSWMYERMDEGSKIDNPLILIKAAEYSPFSYNRCL